MLDLKLIRQKPEWAKEKLAARAIKDEEIDELLALDTRRRQVTVQTEELKAKRNDVSGQIAVMKRNKENADDQIKAMREVGQKIAALDKELAQLNEKVTYILVRLPNFPADDVPMSLNEDDSREEYKWGNMPTFDFEPKHHWDIGEKLGILILNARRRLPVADLFTIRVLVHVLNAPSTTSSWMSTKKKGMKKSFPHTSLTMILCSVLVNFQSLLMRPIRSRMMVNH